jgi:hypothetical protein
MKRITTRLAILGAGIAVPAAIATGAMAATPSGGQTAAQINGTQQNGQAEAQSNQWAPSSNTEVAVGSKDSNNGSVTQAPQSQAAAAAVNSNQTDQGTSQEQQKQQDPSQAQDPSHGQTAVQANQTDQNAACESQSNQWAPSENKLEAQDSQNSNNGNVTQAPSSEAQCAAVNTNTTGQNIEQQKEELQKEEQQKQDQNNG